MERNGPALFHEMTARGQHALDRAPSRNYPATYRASTRRVLGEALVFQLIQGRRVI